MHAFPFRMTEANMARYKGNPNVRVLGDAEAGLRLLREVSPAADRRRVRAALRRQREDAGECVAAARRHAARASSARCSSRSRPSPTSSRSPRSASPCRGRRCVEFANVTPVPARRRRKPPTGPRTASARRWRPAARARRRSASPNSHAARLTRAAMRATATLRAPQKTGMVADGCPPQKPLARRAHDPRSARRGRRRHQLHFLAADLRAHRRGDDLRRQGQALGALLRPARRCPARPISRTVRRGLQRRSFSSARPFSCASSSASSSSRSG